MAVPAYLRQASIAEYITLATRLAAWTLKWCKDERLFTRRERWIVTGDLWTAAKGVLTCAKQANTRRDLADPAQFAEREALLRHALDHLTERRRSPCPEKRGNNCRRCGRAARRVPAITAAFLWINSRKRSSCATCTGR